MVFNLKMDSKYYIKILYTNFVKGVEK